MMRPVSKGKVMANRRHHYTGSLGDELQCKVTPEELLRLVSSVPLTSIMRRLHIDGPTRNGRLCVAMGVMGQKARGCWWRRVVSECMDCSGEIQCLADISRGRCEVTSLSSGELKEESLSISHKCKDWIGSNWPGEVFGDFFAVVGTDFSRKRVRSDGAETIAGWMAMAHGFPEI
jgi:hypothetical protein